MIPLSSLVTVTQTSGPSIVNHYNLVRSVDINGAPALGKSSGQALQGMEAVAQEVLPRGFGYEWSGLSLEEIESGSGAVFIFSLGVVFVYLTLAAQYESYIDPFIIMLTVPLDISGALVTILCRGMASKNAILIVEFANQLCEKGVGMMCIATVLSLFVVPILYIVIKIAAPRFQKRRQALPPALSSPTESGIPVTSGQDQHPR